MPVDLSEYTEQVLHRLSTSDDPSDIIYDICEKAGCGWQEAEQFVKKVQAEDEPEIARRQFPLMFVLALGIFLGGLVLVAYGFYAIIESWKGLVNFQAIWLPEYSTSKMDAVIYWRTVFAVVFGPYSMIFVGTAMILGSLLGMRDTWIGILDRTEKTGGE
jgi:hypothetical protein